MRIHFAIALALTAAVLPRPGYVASLNQDSPSIDQGFCVQDFPSALSPDPNATVVMCDLDNPRGLAFAGTALYVAEAGRGGLDLGNVDCFLGQVGAKRCYGPTGAISRLSNGVQARIATGFPSHANELGRQAIGSNDIAMVPGNGRTFALEVPDAAPHCVAGCAYVVIGLQQPPAVRLQPSFSTGQATFPFANFAKLARVDPGGAWQYVADLGAYETESDPDQVFYSPSKLDTNPNGLLVEPGGSSVLVTDAGGNSLLRIGALQERSDLDRSKISTAAVFAPHPTGTDDTVPTAVTAGPDGAYYVGELTGFPLVRGIASVYRLGRGASPEVCLGGFTQIIDLAFDDDGDLYVLEFQGFLIRVTPEAGTGRGGDLCARYADGVRTVIARGFTMPTSVAIGPDGAAYVSNRGTLPSIGQVVRIHQ